MVGPTVTALTGTILMMVITIVLTVILYAMVTWWH